jgi:pyridoxal phosphate enzyme (YggS family)
VALLARVVTGLTDVQRRIERAGGVDVAIVAVTKGFPADAIAAAVAAGCHRIGENYAQELLAKLADLEGPRPELHFIGRLQSRKVRALAGVVDVWQSVDRSSVVGEIARHQPGGRVMVQVNVSEEPQKGGCAPDEAGSLVDEARAAGLDVIGLMTVGRSGPPEAARAGFRRLRALVDEVGVRECSMGMSEDLEVAVAEGSTMVRVGTALFGARPLRPDPPQ